MSKVPVPRGKSQHWPLTGQAVKAPSAVGKGWGERQTRPRIDRWGCSYLSREGLVISVQHPGTGSTEIALVQLSKVPGQTGKAGHGPLMVLLEVSNHPLQAGQGMQGPHTGSEGQSASCDTRCPLLTRCAPTVSKVHIHGQTRIQYGCRPGISEGLLSTYVNESVHDLNFGND